MKKSLLLAAAACFALGASAQEGYVNHVVNGSFDDPNYVQAVPGAYTWDPWNTYNNLSNLPGWTTSTGGEWNGIAYILQGEDWLGDGFTRPEEDDAFLVLRGYDNNGWADVAASTIVTGLTPGEEYNLDFVMMVSFCEKEMTAWGSGPDPDYGVVISGVDGENAGKLISSTNIAVMDGYEESVDWTPMHFTFVAPADGKAHLKFYITNNGYWDGNKKQKDHYLGLDCISVWNENEPAGVEEVNIADNAVVLGVYNLAGVRVADNVESLGAAKGLYIVRTTNGAKKVVL